LLGGRGSGLDEVVSSSPERGLRPSLRAIEARTMVLEVLASWVKLIVDECHVMPVMTRDGQPSLEPEDLAGVIAVHASWLARHELAGHCADELHELAWGEPWVAAFPSGRRIRSLGGCPIEGCAGPAVATGGLDERKPTAVECLTCHGRWEAHQWAALWGAGQVALSVMEAALALGVTPSSVRQYISRGVLRRDAEGLIPFELVSKLHAELWPEQQPLKAAA
jgi:hypothetical protein